MLKVVDLRGGFGGDAPQKEFICVGSGLKGLERAKHNAAREGDDGVKDQDEVGVGIMS
jgi:hypothetical protein